MPIASTTIEANVKEAVMNENMMQHYLGIIEGVGENPNREGLLDTPKRAAKAMQYLCHGYGQILEQIVNGALFESDNDEMVIVRDIELYSLCDHHMLLVIRNAHVGFMPPGEVLGMSLLARNVDMDGRRMQIPENLTNQIADVNMQVTFAAGEGVGID